MAEQGQAPEKKRRDWVIILIILLIGFLCVIIAGGWAIRFAPTWKLNTDMGSNIDPNSDFLTNRPNELLEPLDPSILTQPAWIDVFLTPGASFETSIPVTSLPTNTPVATNTVVFTGVPPTNTPVGPSPTSTSPYFPPPTNTPKPPQPPTNTPIPLAVDLAITKDDGNVSYIAGGSLTYTITVINNGPNGVTGAIVTDNKPTQITTWSWACTSQTGGATGCDAVTNSGANFSDTIDLPNGASIVYTVTANISGGATGNLVNNGTVSVPAGYSDTTPGNNSSTDTDTLTTTSTDLSITKNDGVTIVNNGDTLTYTVRVTNNGPDAVTGAILSDPAATGLNKTGVACSGTPGQCVTPPSIAQLQNGTFALPALSNGQFYEISITATLTASNGSVANTATIDVPAGVNDPNTGNNSATDTDILPSIADLQITKTDGKMIYKANDPIIYTIVVSNNGPDNVIGATVTDLTLTNATNSNLVGSIWGCIGTGGATCTLVGAGNINDTVTIPSGSSITYTVITSSISNPSGSLVNTASVTAPVGTTDPVPGNNSAIDTDQLAVDISTTNLGSNDGVLEGLLDGETLTVALPSPLNVGSHAGWDLIYFEEDASPGYAGVYMDRVILEIGNGSNWYQIFYWGNGSSDGNTNVAVPLIGNSGGTCATEADNCQIDGSLLSPASGYINGIVIDVDGLGIPAGQYQYLRITAPSSGSSDGAGIDGIYVIP